MVERKIGAVQWQGPALVEEATRRGPDLIVLDITMPELNGIAAARRIRAAGFAGKMVFLTIHADADYVRAALAAGAQGFVAKSLLRTSSPPCVKFLPVARTCLQIWPLPIEMLRSSSAWEQEEGSIGTSLQRLEPFDDGGSAMAPDSTRNPRSRKAAERPKNHTLISRSPVRRKAQGAAPGID